MSNLVHAGTDRRSLSAADYTSGKVAPGSGDVLVDDDLNT